jgi:hypothetical protein
MSDITKELENVKFNGIQSDALKERAKDWLWENIDQIIANTRSDPAIKELVDDVQTALAVMNLEINPSNYDHDQVCELNRQSCHAHSILTNAIAKYTKETA